MSDVVSHETRCLTPAILAQVEQRRAGKRKQVRHHGLLCSKCLDAPPVSETDRYCRKCRAADRRERRRADKETHTKNAIIAAGVRAAVKTSENQDLSKGKDNGQDQEAQEAANHASTS